MRIVFMGSAPFSVPSLAALAAMGHDIVCVVTQPPRAKGRGKHIVPSAVAVAVPSGVEIFAPENVNDQSSVSRLTDLMPDLIAVVAYGQILKKDILGLPPVGCINVHGSLLPRYRGAAPIQWAIANGETVTGITTMHMAERMDAGDMIFQIELPIERDDTGVTLHDRLGASAAKLLVTTIQALEAGNAPRLTQDEAAATYAPRLSKADGRIDWTLAATAIYDRVRGFNPWPCCYCVDGGDPGRVLRVLKAEVADVAVAEPGGFVIGWEDGGPLVATGKGALRLIEVQPEGKPVMSGAAYLQGRERAGRFV